MPRFFFDIHDGTSQTRDEEGHDFINASVACEQAVGVLPDIARDTLPIYSQHQFVTQMRDESGKIIFTATLSLMTKWLE